MFAEDRRLSRVPSIRANGGVGVWVLDWRNQPCTTRSLDDYSPASQRALWLAPRPPRSRRLTRTSRRAAANLHAVEASFDRDYPGPGFKPSWKKPQMDRLFVQDFLIFAHMDLEMVKKRLDKEPKLSTPSWTGAAETGKPASAGRPLGRRDIANLLQGGANRHIAPRCSASLEAVRAFLAARAQTDRRPGAPRFHLHFHAQVGGNDSEKVLDYLQSIKKIELKPNPFAKKLKGPAKPAK